MVILCETVYKLIYTLKYIDHHYFLVGPFVCLFSAVASIQRLPAVSVMTDINFPMKGRKGMVDWARNSEDKVVIPKGLFVSQSAGMRPYIYHRAISPLVQHIFL